MFVIPAKSSLYTIVARRKVGAVVGNAHENVYLEPVLCMVAKSNELHVREKVPFLVTFHPSRTEKLTNEV